MDARERKLRTARRLRTGMVSAGVAGSLGIAGLVGLPALHSLTGDTQAQPTGTRQQTPSRSEDRQAQPQRTHSDDEGERGGDDGGNSFPTSPPPSTQNQAPAPSLQSGTGAPQATTSGS